MSSAWTSSTPAKRATRLSTLATTSSCFRMMNMPKLVRMLSVSGVPALPTTVLRATSGVASATRWSLSSSVSRLSATKAGGARRSA